MLHHNINIQGKEGTLFIISWFSSLSCDEPMRTNEGIPNKTNEDVAFALVFVAMIDTERSVGRCHFQATDCLLFIFLFDSRVDVFLQNPKFVVKLGINCVFDQSITSTSVIICLVEMVVSLRRITPLLMSVSSRRNWKRRNRNTTGMGRTDIAASRPPTIRTHWGQGVNVLLPYCHRYRSGFYCGLFCTYTKERSRSGDLGQTSHAPCRPALLTSSAFQAQQAGLSNER